MDAPRADMLDVIAEELRAPLLRIQLLAQHPEAAGQIGALSRDLIALLDGMRAAADGSRVQAALDLSPLNPAELADEVLVDSEAYARVFGVTLRTDTVASQPVLAHRPTLRLLYGQLVLAMVDLVKDAPSDREVVLKGDRVAGKLRLGAYSPATDFDAGDLRMLRTLFGTTRRPLARQASGPLARLYVADRASERIGSVLRTAIASRQRGFAAMLTPSDQLNLFAI